MTRIVAIQTNFSAGELDPLLRARVDLSQYANGAERLENVLVQPQGGVRRRGGLRYLYELPSAANPQNGTRCIAFEFNVDDRYMLVFAHQRMYVFRNRVLITNINGSGNDYLAVTAVTSSILSTMCWTQSADTLIITHEDINPIKIVRGATNADWTVSNITFDSIPQYAFTLSTSNPAATITPSGISGSITLTASSGVFNSGYVNQYINASPQGRARIVSYLSPTQIEVVTEIPFFNADSESAIVGTATAGTASSITLDASASADDDFYNNYTVTITSGTGSGQSRKISDYVGSSKVATVSVNWTTTPDATSVYSISLAAIPEGSWEYESGYENVWSVTKGWPRTCTFHESRLYFGGSKTRPSTMWGSKVALFFDFKPDQAYDDDAVEGTLDTNSLNVITDMISGRDLQIFTTGGEFYIPQQGLEPITPANFFVKAVSRNGSRTGIRVQQLQSGTLYIQRQGKALNEFQYSDTTASYVSTSISLLSSHLINDPVELALRKSTSTEESDTLFMLNGDGTIAAYSILRQQNVVAPSRFTTNGLFKDVGVDIEDVYAVVKRDCDGTDRYFIESFDTSYFTDCAFQGGAASGATGLPHDGETLKVIVDGNVLADALVTGGALTFEHPSTTSYEVGLNFDVVIKTLPIEPKLNVGVRTSFKKRILEVNAILYETQHLIINDVLVPIRTLDTPYTLDNPTVAYTGIKTVNGLLGYVIDAQITVRQNLPLKLTLLGLDYKLSVYGGT